MIDYFFLSMVLDYIYSFGIISQKIMVNCINLSKNAALEDFYKLIGKQKHTSTTYAKNIRNPGCMRISHQNLDKLIKI